MKFSITHPMHTHPYNPDLVTGAGVAAMASAAEAAGFSGFGFTDHPAPTQRWLDAGGHDALDPFVAMGFAAAHTTTLRLIPNIVVLPYRNPFVVAKSGATLDLLSGGRFTLAIGVGYLKREFTALGVDFEERGALLEEALDVIRTIWTTDDVTYEGRHFNAQVVNDLLVGFKYHADVLWQLESTGRYGDVTGTPDDFVRGSSDLVRGIAPSPALGGARGESLVHDGASVAPGALLYGGTVVGRGAEIGPGVRLDGAVGHESSRHNGIFWNGSLPAIKADTSVNGHPL